MAKEKATAAATNTEEQVADEQHTGATQTNNLPATSGGGAVATGGKGAVAAFDENMSLEDMMAGDAGKGTSQKAEDNIVPLIYVLQTNSPQVNRRSEAFIEGAEPGDFWLRNSPKPIVKGTEGLIFVPCYWWKDLVEWVPRDNGGGFVGRHAYEIDERANVVLPEGAKEERDPKNPQKVHYFMPNGNELVLTANHAGFVIMPDGNWLPYVLPLKSTGLTVSRQWMFSMNSKRTRDGRVLPSFSHRYKLLSRHKKNKEGEWFTIEVQDAGMLGNPDKPLYLEARNLEIAFSSGSKVAEEEVTAGGETGGHDKSDAF